MRPSQAQKKKTFKKSFRQAGPYGSLTTHRYSRHGSGAVLNVDSATYVTALSFSLSGAKGYTELQNLYDRYRLDKIVVSYQLISNPDASMQLLTNTVYNAANWFPTMWYSDDHDDASTETIDQLKKGSGVKNRILKPNEKV